MPVVPACMEPDCRPIPYGLQQSDYPTTEFDYLEFDTVQLNRHH